MMRPKEMAQAAMEYLIIYGIALFIIIIAVVILYNIFGSPQKNVPDVCTFAGGVTCTDIGIGVNTVATTVSITLLLTNSGTEPILLPSLKVNLNGVNSSSFQCTPRYVKGGGSILCIVNLTVKAVVGQKLSGKFYLSDNDCSFSLSSGTCKNSVSEVHIGTFYATVQQGIQVPSFQISVIPAPVVVTGIITVGKNPLSIAFNPVLPTAYVANLQSYTVSVIDVNTESVVNTIGGQFEPEAVVVNPQGSLLYVDNIGSSSISVINTANNMVVNTISLSATSYNMTLSPSGGLLYATTPYYHTVTAINTITDNIINTITVGSNPIKISFNPVLPVVYVSNLADGTVTVINTITSAPEDTIALGPSSAPYSIVFDSSGSYAYIATTTAISVVKTATNSVVNTIALGCSTSSLILSPHGSPLYVSCTQGNNGIVRVVDPSAMKVTNTIPVGKFPSTMAFNPSGSFLYVSNVGGQNITLIDTVTYQTTDIPIGLYPFALAFNPQGTLAYAAPAGGNSITVVNLAALPTANQRYGALATVTAFGLPFRGATINFSTPDPYFQISPRYVLTNSSGEAFTYVTTPIPGATGTIYANLTTSTSANTVLIYR
ncbi:MAG: beta-propeller fold lactonase family protein [Candidatus Micrarchaeota archaeon]|nr:beta-propeller fold lactonase family protein [Candidatus Micrarchaeota archaeon]